MRFEVHTRCGIDVKVVKRRACNIWVYMREV